MEKLAISIEVMLEEAARSGRGHCQESALDRKARRKEQIAERITLKGWWEDSHDEDQHIEASSEGQQHSDNPIEAKGNPPINEVA